MSPPVSRHDALVGRVRSARALGTVVAFLALLILLTPAEGAASAASQGRWSWPLEGAPRIARGFELPTEPWLAGHRGVDLRTSPGDPVRATGAGTVSFAGWVGGLPVVAVTHTDGLRTTYEPVLAAVARGEEVARGSILGKVSAGGSHCLPVACLHWGLRRGMTYLDPLALVRADIQVRLLPIWSEVGSPPSSARAQRRTAPGATSPETSVLARVGALDRARAAAWEQWFG